MTLGLTPRQVDARAAVLRFIALNGRAPSVRDLADAMMMNVSSAARLLRGLIEREVLARVRNDTLVLGHIGVPVSLDDKAARALAQYCLDHGEQPGDVLSDAVTLHLDSIDGKPERPLQMTDDAHPTAPPA